MDPTPPSAGPVKRFFQLLRRHLKKTIAAVVILFIVGIGAASRPKQPTYVTAVARRGDLKQTVDVVGTVISEHDLQLEFPTTDVVQDVLVQEGDQVKAGQKLAALRSGTLSAGVAGASAALQSAEASLRALLEGSRPEDVAVAQAEVQAKLASLDAIKQTATTAQNNLGVSQQQLVTLKNEASTSLNGYVTTANSTISQQLSAAKTALAATLGAFNSNDVQDAIVKMQSAAYETFRMQANALTDQLSSLQLSTVSAADYKTALSNLQKVRGTVSAAASAVNDAYDIMSNLPLTGYVTNDKRETYKATIATQKTAVQTALATLDSTLKTLQDASATYDTKIAAQQSTITNLQGTLDKAKADITTYESDLLSQKAQLDLKLAPPRQTDVDEAKARVNQAQADLSRAAAQYRDTLLIAPVDGTVTKVNIKVGELKPAGPAITMLGTTPYRIEMFVSEVDIPKIQLNQSGSIELDAFRGTHMQLTVGEIDPAATDKDGVTKYRVKLNFAFPHPELKIGMTGDAVIETGIRRDVVSIPVRAVFTNAQGQKAVRVLTSGNTVVERPVETGMEGEGGNVEVTGIKEGETVVVLIKT